MRFIAYMTLFFVALACAREGWKAETVHYRQFVIYLSWKTTYPARAVAVYDRQYYIFSADLARLIEETTECEVLRLPTLRRNIDEDQRIFRSETAPINCDLNLSINQGF